MNKTVAYVLFIKLFFATNNHYLSKVFQLLYQYFKYYDCCVINEIVILLVVIYQKMKGKNALCGKQISTTLTLAIVFAMV